MPLQRKETGELGGPSGSRVERDVHPGQGRAGTKSEPQAPLLRGETQEWSVEVPLVQAQGQPSLSREPQPMPGCVGAGLMPAAFWHGCQACFWVERSRKKDCTEGNCQEGPTSSGCSLPPREGHRAAQAGLLPWEAPHPLICFSQEEMPVPATGPHGAHSLCHPLCLAHVQPVSMISIAFVSLASDKHLMPLLPPVCL